MSARMLARALCFRPVAATLVVLLVYALYQGWLSAAATDKLPHDHLAEGGGRTHYEIVLRFPPEAFHVTRLQAIGRVISIDGPSVRMMDVRDDDARAVARNYWVAELRPWQGL